MIRVTRINGEEILINAVLIECIEATPDTVISMVHGKKIMVRESVDEIVERIIMYHRQIGCRFYVHFPPEHFGEDD